MLAVALAQDTCTLQLRCYRSEADEGKYCPSPYEVLPPNATLYTPQPLTKIASKLRLE